MTEMIASEPALAGRLVPRLTADPALGRVADAVREAAARGETITVTGCGTSHHAALAIASLIRGGLADNGQRTDGVRAVQAFELTGSPPTPGVVIAVSHEGGTEATNRSLAHAGGRDAPTALITVSDRSPGAALARDVLTTGEQDQSWCHTVGYLSPLVVGACLRAAVRGETLSAHAVADQVAAGSDSSAAEGAAAALAGADRLLIVGSGADWAAARELALKVEEGVHLPTAGHELETVRHGHWAAANERTGLVLVLADGEDRGTDLTERAATVLRSASILGMPTVTIAATDRAAAAGPTPVVPVALDRQLDRLTAAILGVVTPLQLLTERLARARGTNPDTIGRDDPRQAAASDFGPWQA
jgi:glucosamine--fructose-6-phosphate aminotransferase (isomerizing)